MRTAAGSALDAQDLIPAPEDLDESSQELDDQISIPVPEDPEAAPAPVSEAPGTDDSTSDGLVAPNPQANAQDDEADCQARQAAALAAGDDSPVSCVSWGASASAAE
ncbi:hypothetical protein ABZV29_41075, partial [Streptomyces sp. NPDC005236]|uniref:hypothetical protein n=1 Tax=Streptomyces sp. NPDC005236 TaxID=3157028 RepID=UPI0033BDDAEF